MDVSWVLGIGFVVLDLDCGLTGFVSSFAALLVLRLALGVSESVAYPSTERSLPTNFPESRRGALQRPDRGRNQIGPAIATPDGRPQ